MEALQKRLDLFCDCFISDYSFDMLNRRITINLRAPLTDNKINLIFYGVSIFIFTADNGCMFDENTDASAEGGRLMLYSATLINNKIRIYLKSGYDFSGTTNLVIEMADCDLSIKTKGIIIDKENYSLV